MTKRRSLIAAGTGLLLILSALAFTYRYFTQGSEVAAASAARLQRGIELIEQEKYAEALQQLEGIPDDSNLDWRVPYYRGSAQMMMKDYPAAATSLERALAMNSHDAGILYALGVVHYKLGNIKLSKAYFAAVLEINPADQHAKGLMDIMTKLEQQPEPGADPKAGDEGTGEPGQ